MRKTKLVMNIIFGLAVFNAAMALWAFEIDPNLCYLFCLNTILFGIVLITKAVTP